MKRIIISIAATAILLTSTACDTPSGATAPTTETAIPGVLPAGIQDEMVEPLSLSIEALGNVTYEGILEAPVLLAGGRYEGSPFVAGGNSRPLVTLLAEPVAQGDLNGDGHTDATVVLVSEMGGSGAFVYLAVVEARDGAPVNTATLLMGDRAQVHSLSVADGRLYARILTHAQDDPACCPSVETLRTYRLEEGQLVAESPE